MQMPVQHPSNAGKPSGQPPSGRVPSGETDKQVRRDRDELSEDSLSKRPSGRKAMRPANSGRRILREKRTIAAMLTIYCADHHRLNGATRQLCDSCTRLLHYAHQRLDNCVFGELKQPCNRCTVHCYSKSLRPRIQEVMRYAGPRMTLRYPLLSALHLLDKLRAR
ncbi:nitrous oxide-stimulated promoter family protein [Halochromatium sp.]